MLGISENALGFCSGENWSFLGNPAAATRKLVSTNALVCWSAGAVWLVDAHGQSCLAGGSARRWPRTGPFPRAANPRAASEAAAAVMSDCAARGTAELMSRLEDRSGPRTFLTFSPSLMAKPSEVSDLIQLQLRGQFSGFSVVMPSFAMSQCSPASGPCYPLALQFDITVSQIYPQGHCWQPGVSLAHCSTQLAGGQF